MTGVQTCALPILASSIALITTSKEEVLSNIMNSQTDDFITNITGSNIVTTSNDEFALHHGYNNENIFEIDSRYSQIQEKYGYENVLLSSRVHITNDTLTVGHWFEWNYVFGKTRVNFLKADTNYEIPNLSGRLPINGNEVIISDFLAFLVFGDEDSIGETIDLNRYAHDFGFVEKELVIVGIIETDYIEKGYLDDSDKLYYYFRYDGFSNLSESPSDRYSFTEYHIYSQIFVLEEAFDDLDVMHKYVGGYGGDINFTVFVNETRKFIWGDFYSSHIVNMDTLIGGLPENDNEISISMDLLKVILPDNSVEIQNLIDGSITWDEFVVIVKLEETLISYDVEAVKEHYEGILPGSVVIVGAYENKDFNSEFDLPRSTMVVTEELIISMNNAYPYNNQGLSFINSSDRLEEMLVNVTKNDLTI